MKDCEVLEKCAIIFPWRQRLYGSGIALAGLEPRVYVCGRGQRLSPAWEAAAAATPSPITNTSFDGRGDHHNGGIWSRFTL